MTLFAIVVVVIAVCALVGWGLWLESPVREKMVPKPRFAPPKPPPRERGNLYSPQNYKPSADELREFKEAMAAHDIEKQKQALAWRLVRDYHICDEQAWHLAEDIVDGKLEE